MTGRRMMDLITGCWCHKIKCSGPLRMGTHGRRVDSVTSVSQMHILVSMG